MTVSANRLAFVTGTKYFKLLAYFLANDVASHCCMPWTEGPVGRTTAQLVGGRRGCCALDKRNVFVASEFIVVARPAPTSILHFRSCRLLSQRNHAFRRVTETKFPGTIQAISVHRVARRCMVQRNAWYVCMYVQSNLSLCRAISYEIN